MKRKFADYPTMERVTEKEYINRYVKDKYFEGNVGLLKMLKVSEPKIVEKDGVSLVIADNNYKWLEMYPNDYKVAMTVCYNSENQIIEWYFDIIKATGIENGIPYVDDLYLDVVVLSDGAIMVLDEDELQEALETKDITQEDYEMAYSIANDLIRRLEGNM